MAFPDFTLESVETELSVCARVGVIFVDLPQISELARLTEGLARG